MTGEFKAALEKLVRDRALIIAGYQEDQVVAAIEQAILAGDFVKYTIQGSDASAVAYLPYHGVAALKAENERLRGRIRNALKYCLPHHAFQWAATVCGCLTDTDPRDSREPALKALKEEK